MLVNLLNACMFDISTVVFHFFSVWLRMLRPQKVLSRGLLSYILPIHPRRKRTSPVTVLFHEAESSPGIFFSLHHHGNKGFVQLTGSKVLPRPTKTHWIWLWRVKKWNLTTIITEVTLCTTQADFIILDCLQLCDSWMFIIQTPLLIWLERRTGAQTLIRAAAPRVSPGPWVTLSLSFVSGKCFIAPKGPVQC